jgi:DNA-binding IclR family transcriptional regulator
MPSRDPSVHVVVKAAAILDALADQREATATELAERVDEPRSSIYRLLATLQKLDLVEGGSRRGTYRLGLKLLRLGGAVVTNLDMRATAMSVMERLHDELGETIFLCVRRDREAVCIERLDGRRITSLALQLGGSLPLHAGAASRALLAFAPRSDWDAYTSGGPLQKLTPSTPTDVADLVAELDLTQRRGYSVSDGDVTLGIAAVGAPIFDHRERLCAAISVSGVRPAILGDDAGHVQKRVVEGALEISRNLGSTTARAG